jgi:hypothetical protein
MIMTNDSDLIGIPGIITNQLDCREYKQEGAQFIHDAERLRFGVSQFDIWNFDGYIAGVIANGVKWLGERGHGYDQDFTPDTWKEYLDSIYEPLKVWADKGQDLEGGYDAMKQRYEAAVEALHRFADYFGTMWD